MGAISPFFSSMRRSVSPARRGLSTAMLHSEEDSKALRQKTSVQNYNNRFACCRLLLVAGLCFFTWATLKWKFKTDTAPVNSPPPRALHISYRTKTGGYRHGAVGVQVNGVVFTDPGQILCDDVHFSEGQIGRDSFADKVTVTGLVQLEQFDYFQICVAEHPTGQRLRVEFKLNVGIKSHATEATSYNADLYVATDTQTPTVNHATWISADPGSDIINLGNHLEEFVSAQSTAFGRGKIIFVGVLGRAVLINGVPDVYADGIPYELSVFVHPATSRRGALVSKSLRGGWSSS
mmetsp:Transcript_22200/g.50234  ORF Transcript_22200/g.50234 Transcript_22200/m.50234 type:complete len:292 (+) Transcript_22200:138-1013(+)